MDPSSVPCLLAELRDDSGIDPDCVLSETQKNSFNDENGVLSSNPFNIEIVNCDVTTGADVDPNDTTKQRVRIRMTSSYRPPSSRFPDEKMTLSSLPETSKERASTKSAAASDDTAKKSTQALKKPGKNLDDFELLRVLGRGAYGKVFLVKHVRSSEILAMKVMYKRALVKANVVSNIRHERGILETISHPNIVRLRYAFQTKEKLYLIMNYVSGGEFFTRLERDGAFIESDAKFYAAEVLLAIEYLHSKDIIYRDLKPENVLFSDTGHAILTDFGFAKAHAAAHDGSHSFCGSIHYLAPEIVERRGHGKSADLWTFGCFIYEMLTCSTPFHGNTRKKIIDNILSKKLTFPKGFSPQVQSLLKKLLTRDSTKRMTIEQAKKHAFFDTVDWKAMQLHKVAPPYNPRVLDVLDVSNFDIRFTNEPVVDSPVPSQPNTPKIVPNAAPGADGDGNGGVVEKSTPAPAPVAPVSGNSISSRRTFAASKHHSGDIPLGLDPDLAVGHETVACSFENVISYNEETFLGFSYGGDSPYMMASGRASCMSGPPSTLLLPRKTPILGSRSPFIFHNATPNLSSRTAPSSSSRKPGPKVAYDDLMNFSLNDPSHSHPTGPTGSEGDFRKVSPPPSLGIAGLGLSLSTTSKSMLDVDFDTSYDGYSPMPERQRECDARSDPLRNHPVAVAVAPILENSSGSTNMGTLANYPKPKPLVSSKSHSSHTSERMLFDSITHSNIVPLSKSTNAESSDAKTLHNTKLNSQSHSQSQSTVNTTTLTAQDVINIPSLPKKPKSKSLILREVVQASSKAHTMEVLLPEPPVVKSVPKKKGNNKTGSTTATTPVPAPSQPTKQDKKETKPTKQAQTETQEPIASTISLTSASKSGSKSVVPQTETTKTASASVVMSSPEPSKPKAAWGTISKAPVVSLPQAQSELQTVAPKPSSRAQPAVVSKPQTTNSSTPNSKPTDNSHLLKPRNGGNPWAKPQPSAAATSTATNTPSVPLASKSTSTSTSTSASMSTKPLQTPTQTQPPRTTWGKPAPQSITTTQSCGIFTSLPETTTNSKTALKVTAAPFVFKP